jgi:hypothetical protein
MLAGPTGRRRAVALFASRARKRWPVRATDPDADAPREQYSNTTHAPEVKSQHIVCKNGLHGQRKSSTTLVLYPVDGMFWLLPPDCSHP